MNLRDLKTTNERRISLEKETGVSLSNVGSTLKDEESTVHCENLIGAISLPLGVAGPLSIKGEFVQKEVYVPLATTEGALVASVNRGAKAITESGGAIVRGEKVGVTRGPVFEVKGIQDAILLKKWITEHFHELKQIAENTSSHLQFNHIETSILGTYVYLRFSFDTDDAMGMNMVTIASDAVARMISEQTGCRCLSLAGNYDIDKKPAWLNFISGRGRKGWAEVEIPESVVKNTLKTEPEAIVEMVKVKCWGGSMMAGSLGFNAHFANITASFFAATGQDLAHVVEGSLGITTAQIKDNGNLYISVYLPDIMIGTVGGGTKLKTQKEAQSILDIATADELCEVFVATVLAGELSLLASLTEGTLAQAHKKLGR